MNSRSLKFRLIVWYAGLLTGCFALLGAATYLVLQRSLVGALKDNQMRRARQIAQLLNEEVRQNQVSLVGQEVETRYAPDLNDRFVRISRRNGEILYLSEAPQSRSFDPASITPPVWPMESEDARAVPLVGGRKLLVAGHALHARDRNEYLVESGAPMDDVQAEVSKWLIILLSMLPVVAGIAVGGGFLLLKRSLAPVDLITASAEQISLHNLSQRLPIAATGDELERLSQALNRMIERLELAFQHSRRFVADASHELRTPLTILRGELETLVQERQLKPEWRDRLGSVLEEVERLANIVEGLFAISRLDAGEAAADWARFDLAQLASSTADQMALLAEDKKIRVNCTGTLGVWVEGDRARLKQVIVNLLDNAIKYTPEGGHVTLKVDGENGKALLEVADDGIGIPPDSLPRVFDRFYRVDTARSREGGGAGLGLSIVKSICAAHHGRVEVSSVPGQGSRFRVELPRVQPRTSDKA